MTKNQIEFKKQRDLYLKMADSSLFFVEKMFKLTPQPPKPEYKIKYDLILKMKGEDWEVGKSMIKADWFGDYNENTHSYSWYDFQKGKHITWQQTMFLLSAEKGLKGDAMDRVSVASGHGCGKSSSVALLTLWFLFGRLDAQIACTAPNATQMNDVLWKELSIWIGRLPEAIRSAFEWNKDYIRMTERPNSWFARAKTSTKENPEALAGVHADWVMMIADEASGVEDQIYHTMEGALTSGKKLVVLISNPTRNQGYFYDSHHKHKERWQKLQFSSIESPIVDEKYEQEQADLHSRGSEQYGIRVLGAFPKEDAMDLEGFLPLVADRDINVIPDETDMLFRGNSILGVDPSGEGDDKTVMVLRDSLKAKIVYEESISNDSSIAEKIISFIDYYDLDPANVVVDSFGIGTNIASKVAQATKGRYIITSVNVGEQCDYDDEKELYENKRAFMFYAGLRNAMRTGLVLVENRMLTEETKTLRYKRNIRGKIQIMGKVQMKKKYGFASPNSADALGLTFLRTIKGTNREQEFMRKAIEERDNIDFNPFEAL